MNPLQLLISEINPPTFDVSGIELNEYELRTVLLQVSKEEIPFKTITISCVEHKNNPLMVNENGQIQGFMKCRCLALNDDLASELFIHNMKKKH